MCITRKDIEGDSYLRIRKWISGMSFFLKELSSTFLIRSSKLRRENNVEDSKGKTKPIKGRENIKEGVKE